MRTVRNVKMPWSEVKKTVNPLWKNGFSFFCSTPKSRHSTHSSWSTVDWQWVWSCNYSDPYRKDKRLPGVGDRQIQMNPQAAAERLAVQRADARLASIVARRSVRAQGGRKRHVHGDR